MSTQDISRFLHQPAKHYSSVRMQQGRVILDSDFNERAGLEAEDLQRSLIDVMCSRGTPNDGMKVSELSTSHEVDLPTNPASTHTTYDFSVSTGSYYIGGHRFVVDSDAESFLTQTDWLQIDSDADNMPAMPVAGGDSRIDLVYVTAWEQTVSAVEDSELREVALGGRDTSVRVRRMRRFEVLTVASDPIPVDFDCADAFQVLVTSLQSGGKGTFDAATGEFLSSARLTVALDPSGEVEDPCATPASQGYVGAQNQAIRVELRGSSFVWGFDNASPLYRVRIADGDPRTRLTFITQPESLPAMPRKGQIVEILRWGSILPNGEKVAEPIGMLTKVATTYDPSTGELELEDEIPEEWVIWFTHNSEYLNTADPADERKFFFLRLWDRGAEVDEAPLLSTVGTTALGSTGLTVTFSGAGQWGDYWVIAARPSTPEKVVPWDLLDSAAPHGPRRYYAPLAMISWAVGAETVTPTVDDCRTRLRKLCEGGCCTVTVGDGKQSHGLVSSLDDAIEMLAGTGGKICVLPGEHEVNAVLSGLTDIVIEGCGPKTVLKNPKESVPSIDWTEYYEPVLKIVDCERITVKDLRIDAYSAFGVLVTRTNGGTCERIRLQNLQVYCLGNVVPGLIMELPESGIAVAAASEVDVLDCTVAMAPVPSVSFAVMLGGEHLRMHRCRVGAARDDRGTAAAPGGVGILSTSRDVEIVGCHIESGWGNGIALGHVVLVQRPATVATISSFTAVQSAVDMKPLGSLKANDFDGCASDPTDPNPRPTDPGYVWLPAGPVEDVRIYDNVIRGMGFSGISTTVFFSSMTDWDNNGQPDGVPRFIVAAELDIARNLIEGNARNTSLKEMNFVNFDVGVGGIVLAASVNAWIHENTIQDNGSFGSEVPICGVGMVAAMNAVIEDNRIVNNGMKHSGGNAPYRMRALRGGIAIYEATPVRASSGKPTFPTTITTVVVPQTVRNYVTQSGGNAVTVRGNEVSQPLGKALWVRRGFGGIVVTSNTLEGFGDPVVGVDVPNAAFCWEDTGMSVKRDAGGACVEVLGFCASSDDEGVPSIAEKPKWVDPSVSGTLTGGALEVGQNTIRMAWLKRGGIGSAVLLSNVGNVVVSANTVNVNMQSDYDPGAASNKMAEFYSDVLSEWSLMSFAMFGVYVGTAASAQVVGNRIVEDKYGCLFSCVVGPLLGLSGDILITTDLGVIMSGNVGSHGIFGIGSAAGKVPSAGSDSVNVVVFRHEVYGYAQYEVAKEGGSARVVCVKRTPTPG